MAVHGRGRVRATAQTRAQVNAFAQGLCRRAELRLSNGGWLRLERTRSGYTLIRYRFGPLVGGITLEGELQLNGEPAEACYRELRRLV